jgi:hypothetical protein
MKIWAVLVLSTLLAACATAPMSPPDPRLFNDQLILAPSQRINAPDVFAVSPAMKHHLSADVASQ